jgi:putative ABC transport system substrate-binding protein
MTRRDFIVLVGGLAASWPVAGLAQRRQPIIGLLHSGSAQGFAASVDALRQGLRDAGFVEGHNVTIEYRWANGQREALPGLAADLTRRNVDVIVANRIAAQVAQAEATSIPIVFASGVDPIRVRLVASLARPGGNITGVSFISLEAKKLEILHELTPKTSVIAAFVNPRNADIDTHFVELQAAAKILGRQIAIHEIGDESEFEAACKALAQQGVKSLVVAGDSYFDDRRKALIASINRYSIAAIYSDRGSVEDGGLMSYGSDRRRAFRVVGNYAARIIAGAKPADLPVVQARFVELVVNLKAAQALSLELPQTLLDRADELIG